VRRADFSRAEQACRRRIAHAPKLLQDGFKTEGDVTGDVLEEDPFGAAFPDDAGDLWPEVAGIIGAAAFACGAEGLTGVSCQHSVEGPAVGACVKAAQVIPDWCGGEIPCALGCDEHRPWPVFPFDESAGVIAGFGEHEAQIQTSAACAEGRSMPGT